MSLSEAFDEARFEKQVDTALTRVRSILDTSRQPTYPSEVSHKYDDKYMLVDFLTNTTLAAQLTCMELLGLNMKSLQQLKKWSASRTITLRLKAEYVLSFFSFSFKNSTVLFTFYLKFGFTNSFSQFSFTFFHFFFSFSILILFFREKCTFDREVTKDVESATKHVTEIKGFGGKLNITDKEITKVTEYFWKFNFSWSLLAYQGNDPEDCVILQQRSGTYEIVTGTNATPRPKSTVQPNKDVNISWLLTQLTDSFALGFSIDRKTKKCRTPRRNPDVDLALAHQRNFYKWYQSINSYFLSLFAVQSNHGLDLNKVNATGTFIPVVPLFEESGIQKTTKEKYKEN